MIKISFRMSSTARSLLSYGAAMAFLLGCSIFPLLAFVEGYYRGEPKNAPWTSYRMTAFARALSTLDTLIPEQVCISTSEPALAEQYRITHANDQLMYFTGQGFKINDGVPLADVQERYIALFRCERNPSLIAGDLQEFGWIGEIRFYIDRSLVQ